MKVVCIIQARTGSTRLPGKILKKICDKTVLEHDIERIKRIKNIDEIVIATTDKTQDDLIVNEALRLNIKYFRGSENDVLSRYYYAAKKYNADIIVRVTSDCPLIDSKVSEETINYYLNNKFDYVSNTYERTFPRGLDTEVFSFKLLEKAFKETKDQIYREHVTTYFWKNPNIFSIGCYKSDVNYSKYRLTLDTKQDLKLIKKIYYSLYKKDKYFTLYDIIDLLNNNEELTEINNMIEQKKV